MYLGAATAAYPYMLRSQPRGLPLHVLGPVASPSGLAAWLAPGYCTYYLLTLFAARAYLLTPRFGLLALLIGGIAYSLLFPSAPPPA